MKGFKKLFILFSCLTVGIFSYGQNIRDTGSLRTNINLNIVPNGIKAISGEKMNTVLNGILNVLNKQVDTIYKSNDTIFYVKNNVLYPLTAIGSVTASKFDSTIYATLLKVQNDSSLLRGLINTNSNNISTEISTRISAIGSLQTQINGKVNISDTANMLLPYQLKGNYLTKAIADGYYPQLTGSYPDPAWITSLNASKIFGVPAGGILYGRANGTIGSSTQFTYDSSTSRATVTANINDFAGYIVTNSSGSSNATASYIATNNAGLSASFGMNGSNYSGASAAGRAVLASETAISLITSNKVITGGTDDIYLYVGGRNVNPFRFGHDGLLYAPDGSVIGGNGGSGGGTGYVTTTKEQSDSSLLKGFINSNTANKIDSVKLVGSNLTQYRNSVASTVAAVAKFFYPTTPVQGDRWFYNASDSTWRNQTLSRNNSASLKMQVVDTITKASYWQDVPTSGSTQRFDTIQVIASGCPVTGNIALRTSDSSLVYRVGSSCFPISNKYNISAANITAITFPTQSPANNLTNTNNVWKTTSTNGAYGNLGLASTKLPSGQDGYIMMQRQSGDGDAILGFSLTNAVTGYASMKVAMYLDPSTGQIQKDDNGTLGSASVTAAIGDWIRIVKTGNVFAIQKSSDKAIWTNVYTYTYTLPAAADLFITCDLYGNSGSFAAGTISNPQGYNIQ